jgi:hypothetical protein
MLVARDPNRRRVEATRCLPDAAYTCPSCIESVILKRCRGRVPHFAHRPGFDCAASEPESVAHLRAKQFLAREFRSHGYHVELERSYPGRRIDVAAYFRGKDECDISVAVEVQDSKIGVELMKHQQEIDRHNGYLATLWVSTSHRARALLRAAARADDHEARVPDEMLHVAKRDKHGVAIVDGERGWLLRAHPAAVVRRGESRSWYREDGDEVGLKATPRAPSHQGGHADALHL